MSPVFSAVIETFAFMRISSKSNPSSRNMPRLRARPAVRNDTSTEDIDLRTLSAASAAPAHGNKAKIAIAKYFISPSLHSSSLPARQIDNSRPKGIHEIIRVGYFIQAINSQERHSM